MDILSLKILLAILQMHFASRFNIEKLDEIIKSDHIYDFQCMNAENALSEIKENMEKLRETLNSLKGESLNDSHGVKEVQIISEKTLSSFNTLFRIYLHRLCEIFLDLMVRHQFIFEERNYSIKGNLNLSEMSMFIDYAPISSGNPDYDPEPESSAQHIDQMKTIRDIFTQFAFALFEYHDSLPDISDLNPKSEIKSRVTLDIKGAVVKFYLFLNEMSTFDPITTIYNQHLSDLHVSLFNSIIPSMKYRNDIDWPVIKRIEYIPCLLDYIMGVTHTIVNIKRVESYEFDSVFYFYICFTQ